MPRIGLVLLVCGLVTLPHARCQEAAQSNEATPIGSDQAQTDANEIELFREYLRIPSVQPNVDYAPVVAYLQRQADSLGLPLATFYPANETKPMVVISWTGAQPELPSILLNSHMDVVAVYPDQWSHPPFAADIDDRGNIFARGAQDMKAAGAQYLAAIRALKASGVGQLKRTIHLVYAADEEIGSEAGWKAFIASDAFESLNAGFMLDEGGTSETDDIDVSYAERNAMKVHVSCVGQSGHAALLLDNTAGEAADYIIGRMYERRKVEATRLKSNQSLTMGDVSTINLTTMEGGIAENVIPSEIRLVFDVRLAITVNESEFIETVKQWAGEAGPNVTVTFAIDEGVQVPTVVGPSNPFWVALTGAIEESGLRPYASVVWASIDNRFIRRFKPDIPTFGFSPLVRTVGRQHADNEYLSTDTYLKGIKVFENIITSLGNIDTN